MKYVKIILLFSIFSIAVYFTYDLNIESDITDYSEDIPISKVMIDANNIDVSIEKSTQNNFSVEVKSGEFSNQKEEIYQIYDSENEVLNIGKYSYSERNVLPKQEVIIKIPNEYKEIDIDIMGNNIDVIINAVSLNDVNINVNENIRFIVNNSSFNNLDIKTQNLDLYLNEVINNNMNINTEVIKGRVSSSTGKKLNLNATRGDIQFDNMKWDDIVIEAHDLNVEAEVSNLRNYQIHTTDNLSVDGIILKENAYQYRDGTQGNTNVSITSTGDIEIFTEDANV